MDKVWFCIHCLEADQVINIAAILALAYALNRTTKTMRVLIDILKGRN